MGLWGPKADSDAVLEPFVLASANIRVDNQEFMELSNHLEQTFGTSAADALKAFAQKGYLSSGQLNSIAKELVVPTWDSVLKAVKNAESQFSRHSITSPAPTFPSASFQADFHQRVNRWAGLNMEWNTFLSGLVNGYMGAAFDVMNERKPRMTLGNRLVLEGCFRSAAAVTSTKM
jgi:hypothetical protein